ncbi:MAG TPA: HAD family phosphatase [Thermoguttaceae bacterium]|nr:HAD family phosphatase [Thermoguttaceae bacterium]
MTPPKFLYFDLGIVLVDFSVDQMFRQMADVSGVEPDRVEEILFDGGLQSQYELGRITGREFYEAFCRQTDTRPDYDALQRAGCDIFELNVSMLPVVAQLRQAGYRMGVLSNTCDSHWEHCLGRYWIIAESFSVFALSCRIGAAKPDAAIFHAAAELAGVEPEGIFFVDDLPGHVAGAKAVGFDAVQYTTTPKFVTDLRKRGIRFNY